jgi:hypothetical protein
MNERIKELADQAIEDMPGAWNIPDEFCKKFAELIVKECMTMCDETRADYFKHRKAADDFTDKNIYAEGAAASMPMIKYKMKKHFGVEE